MADKLKEILTKVLEWWNKFTTRQKSIIVGISAVVIFTFAILIYTFNRPQYVLLQECAATSETAEVKKILEDNSIDDYKISSDGLKVSVREQDMAVANVALGAAGYTPNNYSPKDYLSGGLSTTASDKEKLWNEYLEKQFASDLSAFSNVKSASVKIHTPPQNGTLAAQRQDSSAFIRLELDGIFTSAHATAVAKAAQAFLGNETTANITIMDQDANLLFAGGDDYSTAGIANSMLELQQQAQSMIASQITRVLYGTNQYNSIEVTSHLNMDYAEYQESIKEYYANTGYEQGMLASESTFESENNSEISGVPGASSNDEQVMVNPDDSGSSSSQTEAERKYLPNESLRTSVSPAGAINYSNSSVSIAMIRYREISEENVRNQGLLDGITWEEYKAANSADIKQEVDEDFYSMVATAAGIPLENITIVAYESPIFVDREKMNVNWTNVLSIVMLVIILGLLAFVVLHSMRVKQEETPEEEELSVESLLQSSPENELDEIDVEAKSETRRVVEKFVDDNPESAAALLRNWLNADWA
ncbi:MAG: flagellar M-ring protein FliF [Roseburia sp.]|nr:flagellar M-ring protein FliF [Roseburia sp.]